MVSSGEKTRDRNESKVLTLFPFRLFSICPPAILLLPQWLSLTSSQRNLEKLTELFHYDIRLPERRIHKPLFSRPPSRVIRASVWSPVCQQHYHLSSFPSEIFGQLWLSVCITEVVTLTSCIIPGPLGLIDGQSKRRHLH